MAGWSSLGGPLLRAFLKPSSTQNTKTIVRTMSDHNTMKIQPSRWQYQKFKDLVGFYLMVGLIPAGALILYCNIFIGPAKLTEIPEGYVPKHWEYHRHPITRFISRYLLTNPQQEYEKYLHKLYEEDEKMKMRRLEARVNQLQEERADYQSYYFRPVSGKYVRQGKRLRESLEETSGTSFE